MPSGQLRNRKVQRHDRVHRQHERRREAGQYQVSFFVIAPVPVRSGPTDREETVEELAQFAFCPIPHDGQVRNQPHIPKEDRDREVGRNGEHIPHQRRTELRPNRVRIRDREQPPIIPDTTDVHGRKNSGAHNGKNRHRFGGAIHTGPPALAKQEKNRRDQRSRMANADPPYKVDDVPCPHYRMAVAPDTNAGRNLVAQHESQHAKRQKAGNEKHPPPKRRLPFTQPGDLVREPAETAVVRHQGHALKLRRRLWDAGWDGVSSHHCLAPGCNGDCSDPFELSS